MGGGRDGHSELLIIFGPQRGRRGAETKCPGNFTRGLREKTSDYSGFDTDRLIFKDDELSYALGKQGATRKKLERAAHAILEYVGHIAFIAGTRKERKRAREYVDWLLAQRRGAVTIADVSGRDDATEIHVPENCKGWVTGNRGSELRRMEEESGTFMFMANDSRGEERLIIFSADPGSKESDQGRMAAERLVNELVQEKLRDDGGRGGGGGDSRSPSRRRSQSRRRSPSRRRSRSRSRRRSPSYRRDIRLSQALRSRQKKAIEITQRCQGQLSPLGLILLCDLGLC